MSLQVELPEKKRKNSSPQPSPPPPPSSPSFSLLPDEITLSYLARISRSYYPTLSIVSKCFRSLISSTELYATRSHIGSTEKCLYVYLRDPSYQFPQWFRLCINPNRALPNDMITEKKKQQKSSPNQARSSVSMLVPIRSANFPCVPKSTVAVGSEIYVIGGSSVTPSSALRILDCRHHSWRDGPSMHAGRKNAATCVHDGKIYVLGGCEVDESFAEVFDTKTQTWELLPDPGTEISNFSIHRIADFEGKLYFGNPFHMYTYDTRQCEWECCEDTDTAFWRLESLVGQCSYFDHNGEYKCLWYDIKDDCWKEVKGLDSLGNKYRSNCGSGGHTTTVVNCAGKFFVIWEVYMEAKHDSNNKSQIWCAEIVLEKRNGGELWGEAKWVDVVHSLPQSCQLLHCLAVSV